MLQLLRVPVFNPFGIVLIFVVEALCYEYDHWNKTMQTFPAEIYLDKLSRSEGLNTTIPHYLLVSQLVSERSELVSARSELVSERSRAAEGYVDRCARSYRNLGTYIENRYTIFNFADQYYRPTYKKIRTEYIRQKFHDKFPYWAKNQNDREYKKVFNTYLKQHAKINLDPYGRFFCLLVWLLSCDEWLIADSDGYLQLFRQAILNNSPISSSDIIQVADSFTRCWLWLFGFSSKAIKLPIGIADLDPPTFKRFVNTFKTIENDTATAEFCARVLNQVFKGDPKIVTATLAPGANTVRKWPDMNEKVDWSVPSPPSVQTYPNLNAIISTASTGNVYGTTTPMKPT